MLHNATYERTSMLNHCAAKQVFAEKIIEDEGLPEDEKEKIKVTNISSWLIVNSKVSIVLQQ